MIARVLYRKGTPQERSAQVLIDSLARYRVEADLVDYDGREGSRLAKLYDITASPAVILCRASGEVVEQWSGTFPPAADISYLAHM